MKSKTENELEELKQLSEELKKDSEESRQKVDSLSLEKEALMS